jgi:hypothetical protein
MLGVGRRSRWPRGVRTGVPAAHTCCSRCLAAGRLVRHAASGARPNVIHRPHTVAVTAVSCREYATDRRRAPGRKSVCFPSPSWRPRLDGGPCPTASPSCSGRRFGPPGPRVRVGPRHVAALTLGGDRPTPARPEVLRRLPEPCILTSAQPASSTTQGRFTALDHPGIKHFVSPQLSAPTAAASTAGAWVLVDPAGQGFRSPCSSTTFDPGARARQATRLI